MNGINMKNKKILLDTCFLIYLIENSDFSDKAIKIFSSYFNNWNIFFISVITYIEFLTWHKKKWFTSSDLDERLSILWIKILNLNKNESDIIADLRIKYKIKLPDLICVWTGIENWIDLFITWDKQLKKISEMDILVID